MKLKEFLSNPPKYIYYNGKVYGHGYSTYFGTGYVQLTKALRKHPKHKYISATNVWLGIRSHKMSILTDPKNEIVW